MICALWLEICSLRSIALEIQKCDDLAIDSLTKLYQEAAAAGVKLLSLPECFSFIGSKDGEALSIAEPLTGPIIRRYQTLARHVLIPSRALPRG